MPGFFFPLGLFHSQEVLSFPILTYYCLTTHQPCFAGQHCNNKINRKKKTLENVMSWPAIPLIQYAEMPAVLHDMTCLRSRIYLVFSEVTKLEWGPSEWSSPTVIAAFLKCRIQIDMHRGTVICGEARTLCEKGRKSWEWCTYRPTAFSKTSKPRWSHWTNSSTGQSGKS